MLFNPLLRGVFGNVEIVKRLFISIRGMRHNGEFMQRA